MEADKPTERAPMLSNSDREKLLAGTIKPTGDDEFDAVRTSCLFIGAMKMQQFYEAKITSGELIYIDPSIRGELARRYPELFAPLK